MIDIEKFLISLRNNKDLDGKLKPIYLADTVQEEIKIIQVAVENSSRKWVGLTEEETKEISFNLPIKWTGHLQGASSIYDFARAIEAKLKEKNGGNQ